MTKSQGKQLARIGKRRCWKCKNIYELTPEFFNKCAGEKRKKQFQYRCRPCSWKILNKVRIELIDAANHQCTSCGLYHENYSFFDIDHKIPIKKPKRRWASYKGENISNLQVLCPNCHREKTLKNKDFLNKKLLSYSPSKTEHR